MSGIAPQLLIHDTIFGVFHETVTCRQRDQHGITVFQVRGVEARQKSTPEYSSGWCGPAVRGDTQTCLINRIGKTLTDVVRTIMQGMINGEFQREVVDQWEGRRARMGNAFEEERLMIAVFKRAVVGHGRYN